MATVPVPNTLEVSLRQRLHSQLVVNVFNFSSSLSFSAAAMPLMGNMVASWWAANIRPLVSTDLTATEIGVRDLRASPLAPISITPPTWPLAGTASGVALPSSVCICVTHRTEVGGRSFRGRSYMAGLTEGQVTGNAITSALATSFENAFAALRSLAVTNDFLYTVVSRFANNAPRVSGLGTAIVSSVVRDVNVDTQRRRLS